MGRHIFLIPFYLAACALPLLTRIGSNLEYEYALISAYLMLVLLPCAGLLLPRKLLPIDTNSRFRPSIALDSLWVIIVAPAWGLIPGLLGFWYGSCPCSKTGYLFWMGVIWLPAMVLSHAIHGAIVRGRIRGLSTLQLLSGLLIIYIGCIATVSVQLWTNPQKRIVDFFSGFLHGPIYDEFIAFDLGLMLARSAHLALAFAVLIGVSLTRKTRIAVLATIALGLLGIGLEITSQDFSSVKNSKKDLDELMFASLPGDGFTLRYRPAPNTKSAAEENSKAIASKTINTEQIPVGIERLHRDIQFHMNELRQLLTSTIDSSQKFSKSALALPHVEIYVYPSEDKKKIWFGGGTTDVTDVYTPTVHITNDIWPHPTLRHELVHALTSDIAFYGLGFHPNMAFTEGLAVALAPNPSPIALDDAAASLLDSGRLPSVEELFSPLFWRFSGDRAYTTAGSFIRYLIDNKSIAGVLALYAGKNWQEAFAEKRDRLIAAWQNQILSQYDKKRHGMYTEALFRSPGLFADICPHSKADLARRRSESVYIRMRQPIGWDPDADFLEWLLQVDPQNREVRLRQWRREIRRIATDRWLAVGRANTWREALKAARNTSATSLEDIELALLESDLTRLLGDIDGSLKLLNEIADIAKVRYVGEALTRETEARLNLESQLEPSQANEWRKYLAGWRRSLPPSDAAMPWLVTYLQLRNDKAKTWNAEDLIKLTEVTPDPKVSTSFHIEWYKVLAHRLMQHGQYREAASAYAKAAAISTGDNRQLFSEHSRRAEFYAERGPLRSALLGKPTAKF